ncbi:MAG: recombinase family protein [Chloroflexota bacterium]
MNRLITPSPVVTIYLRATSVDTQSRQRTLQEQEDQCRSYCLAQGWQVGAVYSDETHLRKGPLPGWKQVLAEARAGRTTHLVVSRVDRLGRNLQEVVGVLAEFRALGIPIHAPNGRCFTADRLFEETRQMAAVIPGRISRKRKS